MTNLLRLVCIVGAILPFSAVFANGWVPTSINAYLAQIEPNRAVIERVLKEERLPTFWIALALAESGGKVNAISSKGAAGLWQLMPFIASKYGLKVNRHSDERFDVEKSTRVAARYIKKHLQTFRNDECLAVSAYNMGSVNLTRAGIKTCDDVKRKSYPSYALAMTFFAIKKWLVYMEDYK